MNPQPVSLADELRAIVERMHQRAKYAEKQTAVTGSVRAELTAFANELSALLDQYAVAEPQRVLTEHQRKVEEAAGMPIAPGEQPPQCEATMQVSSTKMRCRLHQGHSGICYFTLPAPPAQERASDDDYDSPERRARRDIITVAMAVLSGAPPDNLPEDCRGLVAHWKPGILATAAKLAREETLELAVKAARDSLLKWKVSTAKWREYDAADIEADIRGTLAAQPSPQKENVK